MKRAIAAIVGRPNVGKSTLFNRLISKRLAIVDDTPGVTRDRLYAEVEWQDHRFILIDTGGLVPETEDKMERIIAAQVEIAIAEADVIIFLVDGRDGLLPPDREVAAVLQKSDTPVVVAVNKSDNQTFALAVNEFYALGFDEPMPVSALQGLGTGDLLDRVTDRFPKKGSRDADSGALRIAIAGRPNVGKSSLINALLREERVIVDNVPGTTRDSIDTPIRYQGNDYIITDTAGIRRKQKISDGVEYYSTLRALLAIERSDVVLVLVDAEQKVTRQDMRIVDEAMNAGKGLMLLVNKWDLIEKDNTTHKEFTLDIREKLGRLWYIPIEFISALERQRIMKPLEMALVIQKTRNKKIQTPELNDFLKAICEERSIFTSIGREIKINYCTQIGVAPPQFVFFSNYPNDIKESHKRFIERNLRKKFDFEGTPVKLFWREKH